MPRQEYLGGRRGSSMISFINVHRLDSIAQSPSAHGIDLLRLERPTATSFTHSRLWKGSYKNIIISSTPKRGRRRRRRKKEWKEKITQRSRRRPNKIKSWRRKSFSRRHSRRLQCCTRASSTTLQQTPKSKGVVDEQTKSQSASNSASPFLCNTPPTKPPSIRRTSVRSDTPRQTHQVPPWACLQCQAVTCRGYEIEVSISFSFALVLFSLLHPFLPPFYFFPPPIHPQTWSPASITTVTTSTILSLRSRESFFVSHFLFSAISLIPVAWDWYSIDKRWSISIFRPFSIELTAVESKLTFRIQVRMCIALIETVSTNRSCNNLLEDENIKIVLFLLLQKKN